MRFIITRPVGLNIIHNFFFCFVCFRLTLRYEVHLYSIYGISRNVDSAARTMIANNQVRERSFCKL